MLLTCIIISYDNLEHLVKVGIRFFKLKTYYLFYIKIQQPLDLFKNKISHTIS